MADTVTLKLKASYGVYNAGERAGFALEQAKRLVSAGIAEPANAKAAQALTIPVIKPPEKAAPVTKVGGDPKPAPLAEADGSPSGDESGGTESAGSGGRWLGRKKR